MKVQVSFTLSFYERMKKVDFIGGLVIKGGLNPVYALILYPKMPERSSLFFRLF